MFVAEQFLSSLVQEYGWKTSSFNWWWCTWYPSQACKYLKLRHHHIHSVYEKSIIERTIEYLKDRTECFDDYFPCKKQKYILKHIINWLNMFIDYHNRRWFLKLTAPWKQTQGLQKFCRWPVNKMFNSITNHCYK